ncbi:hypothetical protein BJ165DRAFT_1592927 [Panaeolus papilionaceus]|nr:hypothetical protein BJ165DRAFT_1592927 [Panaeolus papilionaceus]
MRGLGPLLNLLSFFDGRPAAQFFVGVGLGAGVGLTLKHSLRSHTAPIPEFDEQEGLVYWQSRFKPVLPAVDTTVACPAAGFRIGFPVCYLIDAPPPPNFPLDPVNTTVACPAAGYIITPPACFPIDAPASPPSAPVSLPSPLISKITEQVCDFATRHSDAITGTFAPALYHLLDAVTPARSASRKHLAYLQPLMAVFAIHYLWFVIVAVLLSLEPENVAHQLRIVCAMAGEYIALVAQASDVVWVALQPDFVSSEGLPPQEPTLLYHSRMPSTPRSESTSSFGLAPPAAVESSSGIHDFVLFWFYNNLTGLPIEPAASLPLASAPMVPLATDAKLLPALPSQPSPLAPTALIDAPVVSEEEARRLRIRERLNAVKASQKDRVATPAADSTVLVRRATVPEMAVPREALEEIRSRWRQRELERAEKRAAAKVSGNLKEKGKGKGTPATAQKDPRVSRLLKEAAEGAYPSPRETPPIPVVKDEPSFRARTRVPEATPTRRKASSPKLPPAPRPQRRSSLSQTPLRAPSLVPCPFPSPPANGSPSYEVVIHTFSSPSQAICPPHLDDDCDDTWRPKHIPDLPPMPPPIDDSRAPSPDNLLDNWPDPPTRNAPTSIPDVFSFTSPFLPTHTSTFRERPNTLDSLSSVELSAFNERLVSLKESGSVHSPLISSTPADPVIVTGDDEPSTKLAVDFVKVAAPIPPCFWNRLKVLTRHRGSLVVKEHPVLKELVVVKRVKVMCQAMFEREVRGLEAVMELKVSSQWCTRLVGTFVDTRDMFLYTMYCPNGNLSALIKAQSPQCLNARLARFYLAEMVIAVNALHCVGVSHGSFTSANIFISESRHIVLNDFSLAITDDEDEEMLVQCGLLPYEASCMLDYVEMLEAYQEMYTGRPYTLDPVDKRPRFDYNSNQNALQDLTDLDRSFMDMVIEKVSRGVLRVRHAMAHSIFDGVNWDAMERQEVPVPELEPVPRLGFLNRVHTCQRGQAEGRASGWGSNGSAQLEQALLTARPECGVHVSGAMILACLLNIRLRQLPFENRRTISYFPLSAPSAAHLPFLTEISLPSNVKCLEF